MRMGGFSWLTRRPLPPVTHTHALFANQSHSIPDNLVALLGHSRAWNCSGPERMIRRTRDRQYGWLTELCNSLLAMSASLSRPMSSVALITSYRRRLALLTCHTGLSLLFEVGARPPHDGMRRMGRPNLRVVEPLVRPMPSATTILRRE